MTIWAIGDLHLSLSTPEKDMAFFGERWENYQEKIRANWLKVVKDEDLVLIPGDISWARDLSSALIDLKWIDSLPGTKVLLKGNHDYWWPSNKKLQENLPSSCHFINNTIFNWDQVTIGGTRLWDTEEYSFNKHIIFKENPHAKEKPPEDPEITRKIFEKELRKLDLNLSDLNPQATLRIAMTHYPPIGADLKGSETSKILEKHNIDIAIFGHLHNLKEGCGLFGVKNNVRYVFASSDCINFELLKISP